MWMQHLIAAASPRSHADVQGHIAKPAPGDKHSDEPIPTVSTKPVMGEIQETEPLEEETAISTPSSVRPGTNRVHATPVDHSGEQSSEDSGSGAASLEDIPMDEMLADHLFRARISHGGFNGVVEHIEQGAVTKKRLYRVLYDDGDTQHITARAATRALTRFLLLEPMQADMGSQCSPGVNRDRTGQNSRPGHDGQASTATTMH